MDIGFKNKKLKKLCDQKNHAQQKLGQVCARKLRTRLADLMAAGSVADLVAGRPHPLTDDRQDQFALDLEGAKRLVFEPANDPIPRNEDRSIDWKEVTGA